MQNRRGSEAYDLSLFEPRKASVVEIKQNKKQIKQEQKAVAFKQLFTTVAIIFACVCAVAFFGVNIASRISLTEMETTISGIEQEIRFLESENVRLTDDLVRDTSTKNVEEYARDVLGMEKAKQYQIEYFSVKSNDRIVVAEEPVGFFEGIFDALKNLF